MILISHRGNINGPIYELENRTDYIDKAIQMGYDVEVDLWLINEELFLGHNSPQYKIDVGWLTDRFYKLWVHCKNIESLIFLKKNKFNLNYFWHETDKSVLTSKNYIWSYPIKKFEPGTIAVLPEIHDSIVDRCEGICSDYIIKYNITK
jgi:hypothetical protein